MNDETRAEIEAISRPEVTAWMYRLSFLAAGGGESATISIMIAQSITKRAGSTEDKAVYVASCEAYDQLVGSGVFEKVVAGLVTLLGVAEILVRFANGEDV